jgi:hypothetical protein
MLEIILPCQNSLISLQAVAIHPKVYGFFWLRNKHSTNTSNPRRKIPSKRGMIRHKKEEMYGSV